MDVKLQILKHLARDAHPTVAIVDEYCAEYKDLFKRVFEKFLGVKFYASRLTIIRFIAR